jgi:hypothetical protein
LRRIVPALALSALVLTALPAAAAPNKLQTFGDGVVTAGADSATIVNDAGEYGGVYLKPRSLSATLSGLEISFRSTADVAGGAPRFSIPIDDRDPATKDTYAFLAADRCGGVTGAETVVSTEDPDCIVDLNWTPSSSPSSYANWDAFVAANPTFRVQPGGQAFIIADASGNYAVTDIVLR